MPDLQKGYYNSPRWSGEIMDCSMPMSLDTYNNCAFNCMYCFSFFQRGNGQSADYLDHKVSAVNTKRIIDMFTDPDKYGGQFATYIKRRIPMQWGGLSDGFDYFERKFRKSLELLTFFKEINYPISISTKGTWFVKDADYLKVLYGASNVHWKVSIITLDKEKAHIVEKGVSDPLERFETLRILKDLGAGGTTLRFRPFILGVSEGTMDEMIEQAARAKCDSVTVEFLCLESRAIKIAGDRFAEISRAAGFDLLEFYQRTSQKSSGLMRLSYEIKKPYMDRMRKLCDRYHMEFFVSDAHHKGMSCNAACCGLPSTPLFENYAKGHFAEAIQIAKTKGFVQWSDISEAAELYKSLPFSGSEGFNVGSTLSKVNHRYETMYDYMRSVWNTPTSFSAPARYFSGVVVPSGLDENGDVVYLWNKPFVEQGIEYPSTIEVLGSYKPEDMVKIAINPMVQYPICVISKGRARYATTPEYFHNGSVKIMLYVPYNEVDEYKQQFPWADVIDCPSDAPLAVVRGIVVANARMRHFDRVWMLDDDLIFSHNALNDLAQIEYLTLQYANIGVSGPALLSYPAAGSQWVIDKHEVEKCMLVNIDTGSYFTGHTEFPMLSELEFQLDMLIAGLWHVLVDYRFPIDTKYLPGGMQWAYVADNGKLPKKAAAELHKIFPHHTILNGSDLSVDWKKFTDTATPARLREMMEESHETSDE